MTKVKKISDSASYKEYLTDLFVDAFTLTGTPSKSANEILIEKAQSYGRNLEDAKEDVKRVRNVCSAVKVILDKASKDYKSP